MNRKFPRDPSPASRSSPRRPLGLRRPESRPAAPGSPGTRSKRRVRFEGILDEEAPKASSSSSFNCRATGSHGEDGGGGPKTSEFAFFKRLKEGGGGRSSDAVDGSRFSRPGRNTCGTARDEDPRSFLVSESVTPRTLVPSCSKLHVAIDNSAVKLGPANDRDLLLVAAVDRTKAGAIVSEIYSDWERKVLQSDSTKSRGIHRTHDDVFSEKRHKLRQWVAENSSHEVANLCSKGCDFVSELLKRLFPESSKDKALALLDKERQETDVNYEPVTNPGSDIHLRNHHGIPIKNALRHEYGQHPDVDSLSILSSGNYLDTDGGEFRMNTEVARLNKPTPDIAFLSYYRVPPTKKLRLECGPFSDIGLLSSFSRGCDLLNKPTPASSALVYSTFDFWSEERRIGSSFLKELEKCHEFIGSPFDAEIDDIPVEDFHIMSRESWQPSSCQSTQLSLSPRSTGSWIDNERQNADGFSLSRSSQSLVSYVPREPPMLLFSQATGNISCGFEDHFLGVKDDRLGSLVNLHDHFNEYSSFPAAIGSSGLFHSPRESILSTSKELQEHPHPGSDSSYRLRNGCNLDDEKWQLQLTGSSSDDHVPFPYHAFDHPRGLHISSVCKSHDDNTNSLDRSGNFDYFGEDAIKINDQSSFYRMIAKDQHKELPRLLDGSCYHQSEGKKYNEDSEVMMYF